MKKQQSPGEIASILARAQSPTPPPEWKIHVIPGYPLVSCLLLVESSGCGLYFLLSFLYLGLAPLLGHFPPDPATHSFNDLVVFVYWTIVALILLSGISRLIRECSRQGLVVITTERVIVYDPVRYFRRVRILDFVQIRGMALQKVIARAPDTGHETIFHCLILRDTSGKQKFWSINERYQYRSSSSCSIPVYEDIIAQFECHHPNQTAGLLTYRQITDWRFVE